MSATKTIIITLLLRYTFIIIKGCVCFCAQLHVCAECDKWMLVCAHWLMIDCVFVPLQLAAVRWCPWHKNTPRIAETLSLALCLPLPLSLPTLHEWLFFRWRVQSGSWQMAVSYGGVQKPNIILVSYSLVWKVAGGKWNFNLTKVKQDWSLTRQVKLQ